MASNYSKYAAPPSDTRDHYAAAPPIQLLQRHHHVQWNSGTYLILKLLAVPGNNDSPTYLMSIRYFKKQNS